MKHAAYRYGMSQIRHVCTFYLRNVWSIWMESKESWASHVQIRSKTLLSYLKSLVLKISQFWKFILCFLSLYFFFTENHFHRLHDVCALCIFWTCERRNAEKKESVKAQLQVSPSTYRLYNESLALNNT